MHLICLFLRIPYHDNVHCCMKGSENNVPVGLLNMRITILPCPSEQILEKTMMTQLQLERGIHEESVRNFVTFSKQWMNDFLSIRPGHIFRHVKLSAFDERLASR